MLVVGGGIQANTEPSRQYVRRRFCLLRPNQLIAEIFLDSFLELHHLPGVALPIAGLSSLLHLEAEASTASSESVKFITEGGEMERKSEVW